MRKPSNIVTKENIYYIMEKYEDDYGQFCVLDEYDTVVESIKNNTVCEFEDEMKKKIFSNMKYIYFQRTLCAITILAAFMVFMKFI